MTKPDVKRRAGRPTADEAEQKRQRLVITALEEFARAGFHAASLRDIAERAEVSSRTLYNHFPDKFALFEACLEYSGRQIQPDIPRLEGDLQRRLTTYAIEMQRQLFDPVHLQIARLIYREGTEFDGLRQIAHTQFERHQVQPVATMLEDEGLPPTTSHHLATQFVAMAFGEWQRRLLFGGGPMSAGEMAGHAALVTSIFLGGIGAAEMNAAG
ncbi:transcriptional regulator, TetR family [Sphingomonas laterariae]|uniref:Transcriptional regulator, TetR family n=1 Tax=Edaphosphingomonas laterariae TaxID=861865 RepID=A0A239KF90_9SPHN|nr:TetR/AcrR family transcriptional regulator [Sphingomonas laterariae]SNT16851.1 transcriptional regulator, TetR family [Sphingomonas laterariae]